jgi:hypothetical protein
VVGQADREHGHGEALLLVAHVLAAQRQESLLVELQRRPVVLEVFRDHVRREHVDAGGDGRVRGEDVAGHHLLARLVEGQVGLLQQHADALQRQERAVALVHVKDVGLDVQRFERAHAADAKDDLLLDAHLRAAAVEARGDVAVGRRVFGDVGVEQV